MFAVLFTKSPGFQTNFDKGIDFAKDLSGEKK